ncbi:hypothetical protein [Polaromonas sp. CG9_12]|nr:hypothetical protein [Polaromonas sp. CG9_12]
MRLIGEWSFGWWIVFRQTVRGESSMKPTKPATLVWRLITGLALLLLEVPVVAQDAWLSGKDLFTTNCLACHTSVSKENFTAIQIKGAISSTPCMRTTTIANCRPGVNSRDLRGLSDGDISNITTYLSTPRHASFLPTSHIFDGTAVNAVVKPTQNFTLRNDGDATRDDLTTRHSDLRFSVPTTTTTNTDDNFIVNASNCTGPLAVGAECSVAVTFNPLTVQAPFDPPFRTTFGVNHNGYPSTSNIDFNGASTATASGKGLKNLEIITTLSPFVATLPNTSASQTVTIANRLDSSIRLCLVDLAPFPARDNFNLVGRTYDPPSSSPALDRCATLTAPGPEPKQSISFTPKTNPSGSDGPRYAQLSVQRLDVGGSAIGDAETIDLKGNDGPFANVSTGTLFSGVRQDVNAGAAAPPTPVTVTNAGSAPLHVSSISIPRVAGAGSDEYTASGCTVGTAPLAPGASCNLSVSFDPIDIGTRTTTLTIGYSVAADTPALRTASIFLRGQGTRGARLIVLNALGTEIATGSSEDFGNQNINVTLRRRITLRNIGSDEALAVSARAITPASSGFDLVVPTVAGACPSIGSEFTLAAGDSCVAELTFSPIATTPYAAVLTLPSRPAGSVTPPINFVLNLSGEGVDGRPNLAWQRDDGSALALLEVPGVTSVGTPTPPQVSLRLANLGPGAAALRLLNVIGVDSSSFALEPSAAPGRCSFGDSAPVLGEGSTCSVVITFRPQTAGAKTGRLQLVSTGTTPAPLDIRAQASGPAATIAPLTATPASMTLNGVRVGAQSAPATLTLANDGVVSAVVTAIDASPGFAFEPGSCGALPFSIEPRSSCTLSVRFEPRSAGAASGSLRVQVSGVVAPVEVALQGTGTEAADVSSGGGCSISDGRSPADPTLWALVLLAAAVLFYRRKMRGSASHDRNPGRGVQ